MDRLVFERECKELTGLGPMSRLHLERRGCFPRRKRLAARAWAWLESELAAWIRSREADRVAPMPPRDGAVGRRAKAPRRTRGRSHLMKRPGSQRQVM
jgi:prophage regulatory protein